MKILLLGAGGFLGRHLMVYFRDQGHDVTPVFHKSSVNKDGLSIAMEDERSLASIPLEVEVVINCAAIVPPDQLQILPGHLDPVNGYGLLLLLERLKNLSIHFIHISSSHCLPRQSAIVGGTYEASKFAGEVLCQVYRKQFQNDITLIRPSYIYGPS
ncbi:MAG: NAD(P)-dependent oxidoreductase, partial [Desulfobacula sp.]|nr:NAD(P)-dependent oxidoreductase [Desulfobacula sp.]